MFLIVVKQIIIMMLLLAVGFICTKTKLINEGGRLTLSNLLLMVINPALIFTSFQIDRSDKIFSNLMMSMALAAIVHVIMIILMTLVYGKNKSDRYNMELFFSVYANCGFVGIPLVNSMLGGEGVVYLSGFITVFNVLVWTHGYVTMSGKFNKKQLMKGILSPTMFAVVAGLICFLLGIRLPDLFLKAITYVSDMNTPVAMLVAGAALAGANLAMTFSKKRIYLTTVFKLLLFPAITLPLLHFIPMDQGVAYAVLIASACPAATTGVVFALKFNKDYTYASEIFVVSTLLSMVSIPLVVLAAEAVGIGIS